MTVRGARPGLAYASVWAATELVPEASPPAPAVEAGVPVQAEQVPAQVPAQEVGQVRAVEAEEVGAEEVAKEESKKEEDDSAVVGSGFRQRPLD